jgi:hypothetical protein
MKPDHLLCISSNEVAVLLVQGAGKGVGGAGKGKRVMGGGGLMSQTAQQTELKLEQMVDRRDIALANANGDTGVEPVTRKEIVPISEVLPAISRGFTKLCQLCIYV